MPLKPQCTSAELKELRALTGDDNGAQRVAFTPVWVKTRAWLQDKLAGLPVETHTDAAGNFWATLRGESDRLAMVAARGSHHATQFRSALDQRVHVDQATAHLEGAQRRVILVLDPRFGAQRLVQLRP